MPATLGFDVETAVRDRYAAASNQQEVALCCPTAYARPELLDVLPQEIIERDYGCGDPTPYVREGDVALDLGSGTGKVCYMLSQVVGPPEAGGGVIGVDFNDAMLDLAREHRPAIARKIGHDNVRFLKGKIQDLALDLDAAQAWLSDHPIQDVRGVAAYEAECDRLRRERPLVENASVDVIVSSCVLNLVQTREKAKLFGEMHRVLRRGGRAVISDIVCDEPPTQRIMEDPELWSGCISGAFLEDEFLRMFTDAGFYGVEVLKREREPWQTIDGIEFRSMTVRAFKGKEGACMERLQAVVYRGPFSRAHDDDGHVFLRGERVAVCDKTFRILTSSVGPYAGQFDAVEPLESVPLDDAQAFDCKRSVSRHPRETKGLEYRATSQPADGVDCCGPDGCC